MSALVVVTHVAEAQPLILWGARFAEVWPADLAILCWVAGEEAQAPASVSPEAEHEGDPLLQSVARAIEQADLGVPASNVTLHKVVHPDPVKAILSFVAEHDVDLLLVGTDPEAGAAGRKTQLGDRLLRRAPCSTILLEPAKQDAQPCRRILVPLEGPRAGLALRIGARLADACGAIMVPLLIESEIGEEAHVAGEHELAVELRKAGVEPGPSVQPKVQLMDRPSNGVRVNARDCDLVLIGAASRHPMRQLRLPKSLDDDEDPVPHTTAMAVLRDETFRRFARDWSPRRLLAWLPQMEFAERVDLFDRLKVGSRWNVDFIMMLSLATGIASLGLLKNSAAIVIGGMLVAPLMTPMIGAGLALIQGNIRLAKEAIRAIAFGFLISFAISLLFGLLVPVNEMTPQLEARGAPNILDLVVALLSGAAAAYAMARPNLMGALAGVAVAVALVPPISTIGISIAQGEFSHAIGAALLFATNLVAIVLGASIVFAGIGLYGVQTWTKGWVRGGLTSLVVVLLALTAPLMIVLHDELQWGMHRLAASPVTDATFAAVKAQVARQPGTSLLILARPERDRGYDVLTLLAAQQSLPREFAGALAEAVRGEMGKDIRVAVFSMLSAWAEQADKPVEVPLIIESPSDADSAH